ncbi:putative exoribonuclease [Erwinia phage pEa_SNUABM_8]|nr:putative exoribonuclease [Erwinia phage pEa_SNUABM_8]QVW54986.1 hypothetical protein pEaSNUABM4_00233 [Erwinia phage pEa_SNUABM_4]
MSTDIAPGSQRTPSIYEAAPVRVPQIVIGVDGETKSMRSDAYLISLGMAAWDVTTLRLIGAFYQTIDPNDEKAKAIFHEDPSTLAWWRGEGDNPDYAPCPEAYKEAFSGTMKMPEVLWSAYKFLEGFKAPNRNVTLTMRGPDFDHPILMNAFAQCDVPTSLLRRFSMLDSDRTAERIASAMGLEPNYDAESHNWTRGKEAYLHHAGYDAAREGYITARIYHLALVAKRHGFERMLEAHHQICTGEYAPMEFLREA